MATQEGRKDRRNDRALRQTIKNTRKINSAYIAESVHGGVIQWCDCVAVDTNYIGPECTLTVNVVGSGSDTKSPDQSFYNWGTNVTLTATATTGWSFDHWTLNDMNVGSVNPYTINMTADYDLTAAFTKLQYNYLVVRGGDNMVYYRIYNASSASWQDWNVVPDGSTLDSPAAALYSGKLYFVVRGMDSSIYYNVFDGAIWTGWTVFGQWINARGTWCGDNKQWA